ncbi:hypothetical protein HMPREF0972_02319 [Actinomyces sp. oral taxon 848 str. F0332]|nr:hypothetical protein HMPREF0972_02319 [Actinomyces sp. oral taxon 848 str. F0332]
MHVHTIRHIGKLRDLSGPQAITYPSFFAEFNGAIPVEKLYVKCEHTP